MLISLSENGITSCVVFQVLVSFVFSVYDLVHTSILTYLLVCPSQVKQGKVDRKIQNALLSSDLTSNRQYHT